MPEESDYNYTENKNYKIKNLEKHVKNYPFAKIFTDLSGIFSDHIY